MIVSLLIKLQKYSFLFIELTKRDFKKKYKNSWLGIGWSALSPLFTLLVMRMVFGGIFGRNTDHYTTYIFCGNLVYSYFKEATSGGMGALVDNATIFSKINVPKYIFLLTKNVSATINFCITLIIFFIFALLDNVNFTWSFIFLIYPILCLMLFNIGCGLILSALNVFFRDTKYLYDLLTLLLMYLSAIFYKTDMFEPGIQKLFYLNPVFCYIDYFRSIVLRNSIPTAGHHLLCIAYAIVVLLLGSYVYKKKNHEFLYYL